MKTKWTLGMACVGACLLWAWSATAGPSLAITKPPVQPSQLQTGPRIDSVARNGQWFIDRQAVETVRTNEFYDDVMGGQETTRAISGHVSSVQFAIGLPPQPITAFSIEATIINDTGLALEWASGSNSHGETLTTAEQYAGSMVDTKLAAEFAIVDLTKLPQPFLSPYRDRQPYIVADNEDQAAWYCWNPDEDNPGHQPKGDYYVPTWNFGTIDPGKSATRSLHFSIPAGLPFTDSRYAAIMQSYTASNDVLHNRTTSLKISTWIDDIAVDLGNDEEQLPLRHSSVSVFHNQAGTEPELLDFGDAPDPTYPTLLVNNGARHVIVPGVRMGLLIDAEPDGQPDANATGDDKANLDDEDGVVFLGQLLAGQTATVQVMVSTSGYVHAWLDFNANGNWTDAGEKILNGAYLSPAGIYNLPFSVPGTALATNTFARFRFTTAQTPLGYTGQAPDGEVEDHMVDISEEEPGPLDFGDAPDPTYPTLLASNGARHGLVPGVFMGQLEDPEANGQPTLNADGDDSNPPMGLDDEDGVTFVTPLYPGNSATVQVVCSVSGFLSAWLDFNADGDWADAGENIFAVQAVPAGTNALGFTVPASALVTNTYARFRFTTLQTPIGYTGYVPNGEVEDYKVAIQQEPEQNLDFGDAPDPTYPTLLPQGARHVIVSGAPWFGDLTDGPDPEPDGQPDPGALGDDQDLVYPPINDDEDGVSIPVLTIGQQGTVTVTVSGPPAGGWVDAWIDWNGNGTWEEPAERIYGRAMPLGVTAIPVTPPAGSPTGTTFARFRIHSAQGNLPPTGLANDGEVEDHYLEIQETEPDLDFGDAPDPTYPTLLPNGARHVIVPGVFLGQSVDAEPDGQPTPNADGDDLNPPPIPPLMGDEDGVFIPKPLIAGATVQVPVVASTNGFLNAWIDWNSDGDWADLGEQAYTNAPLNPGTNNLVLHVPVPPALVAGGPHSRWRFTTYPPPMPLYIGQETDGEVEDYEVQLEVLDFGDAPDIYQTLLASDGARHRIPSAYWLGANPPDLEPDGQPTADADGDDNAGATPDDEDGVFVSAGQALVQGNPTALLGVIASTGGVLNAWLDFDGDGNWVGASEWIAKDLVVPAGVSPVPFVIPATARLGPVFGRFRFASKPGLGSTSLALDGEVEDHVFTIYQNGPTNPTGFEITNIVKTATNEMTIWWAWESNVTYQTQYATNLLSDSNVSWTAWGGYVFSPPYLQRDTNAVETTRFYRVVAPWSPPPP